MDWFEPDFNDQIRDEPIYHWQIKTLKRLQPDLTMEKILSFTSSEAITFINSIRTRKIQNNYRRLNLRWANRHKAGGDPASTGTSQHSVVASLEVPSQRVQVQITMKEAKT